MIVTINSQLIYAASSSIVYIILIIALFRYRAYYPIKGRRINYILSICFISYLTSLIVLATSVTWTQSTFDQATNQSIDQTCQLPLIVRPMIISLGWTIPLTLLIIRALMIVIQCRATKQTIMPITSQIKQATQHKPPPPQEASSPPPISSTLPLPASSSSPQIPRKSVRIAADICDTPVHKAIPRRSLSVADEVEKRRQSLFRPTKLTVDTDDQTINPISGISLVQSLDSASQRALNSFRSTRWTSSRLFQCLITLLIVGFVIGCIFVMLVMLQSNIDSLIKPVCLNEGDHALSLDIDPLILSLPRLSVIIFWFVYGLAVRYCMNGPDMLIDMQPIADFHFDQESYICSVMSVSGLVVTSVLDVFEYDVICDYVAVSIWLLVCCCLIILPIYHQHINQSINRGWQKLQEIESFSDLIEDKLGYESFLAFLQSEFSQENLLFWQQASAWERECLELENQSINHTTTNNGVASSPNTPAAGRRIDPVLANAIASTAQLMNSRRVGPSQMLPASPSSSRRRQYAASPNRPFNTTNNLNLNHSNQSSSPINSRGHLSNQPSISPCHSPASKRFAVSTTPSQRHSFVNQSVNQSAAQPSQQVNEIDTHPNVPVAEMMSESIISQSITQLVVEPDLATTIPLPETSSFSNHSVNQSINPLNNQSVNPSLSPLSFSDAPSTESPSSNHTMLTIRLPTQMRNNTIINQSNHLSPLDLASTPALTAAIKHNFNVTINNQSITQSGSHPSALARLRRVSWTIALEKQAERLKAYGQSMSSLSSDRPSTATKGKPRSVTIQETTSVSRPRVVSMMNLQPNQSIASPGVVRSPFMQSLVRALQATRNSQSTPVDAPPTQLINQSVSRNSKAVELVERACQLFDHFIAAGSAQQVNLPDATVQAIKDRMYELDPIKYPKNLVKKNHPSAIHMNQVVNIGHSRGPSIKSARTLGFVRNATRLFMFRAKVAPSPAGADQPINRPIRERSDTNTTIIQSFQLSNEPAGKSVATPHAPKPVFRPHASFGPSVQSVDQSINQSNAHAPAASLSSLASMMSSESSNQSSDVDKVVVPDLSKLSFPLSSLFTISISQIVQLMEKDSFKRYVASRAFEEFCKRYVAEKAQMFTFNQSAAPVKRVRRNSKSKSRAAISRTRLLLDREPSRWQPNNDNINDNDDEHMFPDHSALKPGNTSSPTRHRNSLTMGFLPVTTQQLKSNTPINQSTNRSNPVKAHSPTVNRKRASSVSVMTMDQLNRSGKASEMRLSFHALGRHVNQQSVTARAHNLITANPDSQQRSINQSVNQTIPDSRISHPMTPLRGLLKHSIDTPSDCLNTPTVNGGGSINHSLNPSTNRKPRLMHPAIAHTDHATSDLVSRSASANSHHDDDSVLHVPGVRASRASLSSIQATNFDDDNNNEPSINQSTNQSNIHPTVDEQHAHRPSATQRSTAHLTAPP